MEASHVNAAAAGLGAGLGASISSQGKALQRTFESVAQAQQAMLAQTKAVDQYFKLGCGFEAKKQWGYAEKAFTYVLQVISRRDGPGSMKSLPVLEHLASINKAQNKLDDAIRFQKTVVAFSAKKPDDKSLLKAQDFLSGLYIQKKDYAAAEPVLRKSVSLLDKNPSFSPEQRIATLRVYGQVLRNLQKEAEAKEVEAAAYHAAQAPTNKQLTAPGGAVSGSQPLQAIAPRINNQQQVGPLETTLKIGSPKAPKLEESNTQTTLTTMPQSGPPLVGPPLSNMSPISPPVSVAPQVTAPGMSLPQAVPSPISVPQMNAPVPNAPQAVAPQERPSEPVVPQMSAPVSTEPDSAVPPINSPPVAPVERSQIESSTPQITVPESSSPQTSLPQSNQLDANTPQGVP